MVALEMARRLTDSGQEVSLLAFIDTFHPQMAMRKITALSRLGRLLRERGSYVREALERRRVYAQQARDDSAIEGFITRGEPVPFHLRERHLWRNFEKAQGLFRVQPWKGKAVLFRARDLLYYFQGSSGGETYGWDQHILDGVEVVTVPGDHTSLLLGTNAELLVSSLSAAIDRASQPRFDLAVSARVRILEPA
jgi:thioesterase domain-containing protein